LSSALTIRTVRARAVSFALPAHAQVSLGIGRTIKRDAVIVEVTTAAGVTGYGEAHAARAPTAIAELINSTLADLVVGMAADQPQAVWERVYRMQLASHGAGAAAAIGLSGIDLALWDIQGKAAGLPVWQLLGGSRRAIQAYAGGIALGFQAPEALVHEAQALVRRGYQALKVRVGDAPALDGERVAAVRAALGEEIVLMTDANCAMDLGYVEAVAPALEAAHAAWLEEPFPAHDYTSYRAARALTSVPLAAGENHYTRFDFERVRDDGAITIWQPDLSKTGGLTEALRIATLAASRGFAIHPHTSVTALNMAASLHFLSAIEHPGFYEADVSAFNPLRDALAPSGMLELEAGRLFAPTAPGLGIEVSPDLFERFPAAPGAGYV